MMKHLIYLIIIISIIILGSSFTKKSLTIPICITNDSTIKQRFIVSLLSEYEQEGRWVFLKMERCKNQSAYEIVQPISLFKSLADYSISLDKKQFIWNAFINLNSYNAFASCPEESKIYFPKASYSIEGIRVNMKKYALLKRMPIKKILATYFDAKKNLKKQYTKNLTELIAVCYTNNVKVITLPEGAPYYEVFK